MRDTSVTQLPNHSAPGSWVKYSLRLTLAFVSSGQVRVTEVLAKRANGEPRGTCDHVEGTVQLHSRLGLDLMDLKQLDFDHTTSEHRIIKKTLERSLFGAMNLTLLRRCTSAVDASCAKKIKHTVLRDTVDFGNDRLCQVLANGEPMPGFEPITHKQTCEDELGAKKLSYRPWWALAWDDPDDEGIPTLTAAERDAWQLVALNISDYWTRTSSKSWNDWRGFSNDVLAYMPAWTALDTTVNGSHVQEIVIRVLHFTQNTWGREWLLQERNNNITKVLDWEDLTPDERARFNATSGWESESWDSEYYFLNISAAAPTKSIEVIEKLKTAKGCFWDQVKGEVTFERPLYPPAATASPTVAPTKSPTPPPPPCNNTMLTIRSSDGRTLTDRAGQLLLLGGTPKRSERHWDMRDTGNGLANILSSLRGMYLTDHSGTLGLQSSNSRVLAPGVDIAWRLYNASGDQLVYISPESKPGVVLQDFNGTLMLAQHDPRDARQVWRVSTDSGLPSCVKETASGSTAQNAVALPPRARFSTLCELAGGSVKKHAKVQMKLQIGMPNRAPPYWRSLTAAIRVAGHPVSEAIERVVVTGDRFLSDLEAVPFPEGKPLLVIHDPPGGSSYSDFKDTRTSTTFLHNGDVIKSTHLHHNAGSLGIRGNFGEIKMGPQIGTVVGLGAAVAGAVSIETGVVGMQVTADAKFSTSYSRVEGKGGLKEEKAYMPGLVGGLEEEVEGMQDDGAKDYSRVTESSDFQFTYRTSNKPDGAGPASDMFLMPAATIEITSIWKVKVDGKCRVIAKKDISWTVRPSRIPSLCTRFTRAGIEWCYCHRAVCMVRPR